MQNKQEQNKQDQFIPIPKSLAEVAEDRIRQMIINGDLEFGEQITEMRLSHMFNLSKTPIREALLRLSAAERLVQIKPRCGTAVFTLTEKEIIDISAARIIIEQGAIRSAMKNNPDQLIEDLSKNIEISKPLMQSYDIIAYREIDSDYHNCLLHHTQNPYLIESYRLIFTKVLAMRNRLTFSHEYMRKSIQEHIHVVDALKQGQIDQACNFIHDHINQGFTERTRRLLSSTEAAAV